MSISNMQVLIPSSNILNSNIRSVLDILALKHLIHISHHEETCKLLPWKQRHKVTTDKVKTGEIQEGAEVVGD